MYLCVTVPYYLKMFKVKCLPPNIWILKLFEFSLSHSSQVKLTVQENTLQIFNKATIRRVTTWKCYHRRLNGLKTHISNRHLLSHTPTHTHTQDDTKRHTQKKTSKRQLAKTWHTLSVGYKILMTPNPAHPPIAKVSNNRITLQCEADGNAVGSPHFLIHPKGGYFQYILVFRDGNCNL